MVSMVTDDEGLAGGAGECRRDEEDRPTSSRETQQGNHRGRLVHNIATVSLLPWLPKNGAKIRQREGPIVGQRNGHRCKLVHIQHNNSVVVTMITKNDAKIRWIGPLVAKEIDMM